MLRLIAGLLGFKRNRKLAGERAVCLKAFDATFGRAPSSWRGASGRPVHPRI